MTMATAARIPESVLMRPTLLGLLRHRWLNQMSLAGTEIRWHQKRIDLAFMSPRASIGPVAIELKVDSPRRAIKQASLNRLLTPSSWVALGTVPARRTIVEAERAGVGLLVVLDSGVYPLVFPTRIATRTDILAQGLRDRSERVRDLLSRSRDA